MPPFTSVRYSASSVGADSFKFKASDGSSDSNEVTVTTDNVPAVNDPPQCSASQPMPGIEVGDLPSFAGPCFDDEGENLTITITQQPQKGTAEVVDQGSPFSSVRLQRQLGRRGQLQVQGQRRQLGLERGDRHDRQPAGGQRPARNASACSRPGRGRRTGDRRPLHRRRGRRPDDHDHAAPQKGTLEIVDQGTPSPSLRYTATSVGPDSFSYKASDGSSDSNEATTTTVNVDTTAPQTTIDAGPAG